MRGTRVDHGLHYYPSRSLKVSTDEQSNELSDPLFPVNLKTLLPQPIALLIDPLEKEFADGHYIHATLLLQSLWTQLIKFLGVITISEALKKVPADRNDQRAALLHQLFDGLLTMGKWKGVLSAIYQARKTKNLFFVPDLHLLPEHDKKNRAIIEKAILDLMTEAVTWRNESFAHGMFTGKHAKDPGTFIAPLRKYADTFTEICKQYETLFGKLTLGYEADGKMYPWPETDADLQHEKVPDYTTLSGILKYQNGAKFDIDLGSALSLQFCPDINEWGPVWLEGRQYPHSKGGKSSELKFLDFDHNLINRPRSGTPAHTLLDEYKDLLQSSPDITKKLKDIEWNSSEIDDPRFQDISDFIDNALHGVTPNYIAKRITDIFDSKSSHIPLQEQRGVFIIEGPSGIGKSWAAAMLLEALKPYFKGKRDLSRFYVPLDDATLNSAERVCDYLRLKMANTDGWKQQKAPSQAPEDIANLNPTLTRLMQEAIDANDNGRSVFVLLDGLDMLSSDSDIPDLINNGDDVPVPCFFMLFTRPDPEQSTAVRDLIKRLSDHPDTHRIELRTDDDENKDLLRTYLNQKLDGAKFGNQLNSTVEAIMSLADYRFLYVHHYADLLNIGAYADVSGLPAPKELYSKFFDHRLIAQLNYDVEFFENHHAKVLALFAVARDALTIEHLQAWTRIPPDVLNIVLKDLSSFLKSGHEEELEHLTLAHGEIRNYFETNAIWRNRLKIANRNIVSYMQVRCPNDGWENASAENPVDFYGMTHMFFHMTEQQQSSWSIEGFLKYVNAQIRLRKRLQHIGKLQFVLKLVDSYIEIVKIYPKVSNINAPLDWQYTLLTTFLERAALVDPASDKPDRYLSMGEALSSYKSAFEIIDKLENFYGQIMPPEKKSLVATSHLNRGNLFTMIGRKEEAVEDYDRAISIRKELRKELGKNLKPEFISLEANSYICRGNTDLSENRFLDALTFFNEAVDSLNSILEERGGDMATQDWHKLARALYSRSICFGEGTLNDDDAISDLAKAQSIWLNLIDHILKDSETNEPRVFDVNWLLYAILSSDRLATLALKYALKLDEEESVDGARLNFDGALQYSLRGIGLSEKFLELSMNENVVASLKQCFNIVIICSDKLSEIELGHAVENSQDGRAKEAYICLEESLSYSDHGVQYFEKYQKLLTHEGVRDCAKRCFETAIVAAHDLGRSEVANNYSVRAQTLF
jgi:tetratricopeptide (TPR) repeat protein